jgi:hypothetical protein
LIVVSPTWTCTNDFGAKGVPDGTGVSVIAKDGCKDRTNKEEEQVESIAWMQILQHYRAVGGLLVAQFLHRKQRGGQKSCRAQMDGFVARGGGVPKVNLLKQ